MECNRDEAMRAKEIGEKKLTEKDIAGAKKFALKAQSLYPELDGLSQFLATLEVYVSSEKLVNGVHDYYGILGVDPKDDENLIRKHYRRMALILHPDKNKSVGADGAFKIISEAWSLLSDPSKRSFYDQQLNLRTYYRNVSTANPSVSAAKKCNTNSSRDTHNGVHTKTDASSRAAQNGEHTNINTAEQNGVCNQSAAGPSTTPSAEVPDKISLWTVCSHCRMQYEYQRKHMNRNLLCYNCRKVYCAVEIAPPPTKILPWVSYQEGQNVANSNLHVPQDLLKKKKKAPPVKHVSSGNIRSNGVSGVASSKAKLQPGGFSKTAGSQGSQAAPSSQPPNELNKIHEEAHAIYLNDETLQKKFQVLHRESTNFEFFRKKAQDFNKAGNDLASQASTHESSSTKKRKIDVRDMPIHTSVGKRETNISQKANSEKERGFSTSIKSNGTRDFSQRENRIMLMKKARMDMSNTVNEWKQANTLRISKKLDALAQEVAEKKEEIEKGATHGVKCGLNKPTDIKSGSQIIKSSPATLDDTESIKLMTMSVPDSDFHDFDKDRLEKSFCANQVWAAYDNDDGMPRFYVMVQDVVSVKPFKMKISWLNSKSNAELAPIDWVANGFAKTCGDFYVGKHKIYNALNAFSHKVNWEKGSRGVIQIYPTKGDIWALFRNWSPKWDVHTPDEVVHKYEMVEVLEDYNEEQGVTVAPLVKVAGFKTVFHQHLNPEKLRTIKKEELFRFSHQIPSYVLTGEESPNALKGCRELDPASTPMEFQNVITEVKGEDEVMINKSEDGDENLYKNAEKTEM